MTEPVQRAREPWQQLTCYVSLELDLHAASVAIGKQLQVLPPQLHNYCLHKHMKSKQYSFLAIRVYISKYLNYVFLGRFVYFI